MKAFLMHPDRDFQIDRDLPPQTDALTQDLGLAMLLDAMADGDEFLFEVARHALLDGLGDPDAIAFRQQVLADCLREPAIVHELYDLTVETLRRERQMWRSMLDYPSGILHRAVQAMELYAEMLPRLRAIADEHAARFASPGFSRFFAMLSRELDDAYLATIDAHLRQLRFSKGVLVSAELGTGNRGVRYVLRRPHKRGWIERLTPGGRETHTLRIPERDQAGADALARLRDQGVNLAAGALAQAADHILSFFTMVRRELGFYVGCLNLDRHLAECAAGRCMPSPAPAGTLVLSARELYDPGLRLRSDDAVVGNDLDTDGASLVMITGANQGGKSTFLRSVGLAQLMMQAGMFVAADAFSADVRTSVFTHYKREEDDAMEHGKFDEELDRMSAIAEHVTPGSIVLFNESFAATNEREGSEIARLIIRALREAGVRVVFVTHMYDLAHSLHEQPGDAAAFLRAERREDGTRTFRLVPGEPLATSYGLDLYERIFDRHVREPAAR